MTAMTDSERPATHGTVNTSCGICGSATQPDIRRPATSYAERGKYGVATCGHCGSGRTVPFPSPDELNALYAKEYEYGAHLLIATEKKWRARRILDTALPPNAARILDIGCMYGYLLEEAKLRGIEVAIGVELATAPARAAIESGHDVFRGTIREFAETAPKKFDLIVAQHVLEHIADPVAFLESASALLAPGGNLCLSVPNYDARARRLFRDAWGWYQVPFHLHHFGSRGLESVLDRAGLEAHRTERRGGDSLFVLITLLQSIGRMPTLAATKAPSSFQRALLRTASSLLRPYFFIGDDELLVVATRR